MKRTLLALLTITALAGCTAEDDDIDAFLKNPGVSPKRIEKLATTKQFPSVQYSRALIRDPFIAKLTVAPSNAAEPPVKASERQPLEMFSLESLAMVGMVHIDGKPYALIKDPEAQVHRVTLGQRLGQNYGKVIQFTKNGVQLKESIQNNTGAWVEIDSSMPYQESDNLSSRR